jgi:beta-lactamase regulating signal transducer with metallopeptidase domain
MHPLVEVALVNAVMASLFALVAAAAGSWFRRPALSHALWLLVLVKLITPPLWRVPVLERDWISQPVVAFGVMLEKSLTDPLPVLNASAISVDDPTEPQAAERVRPKVMPATPRNAPRWPRSWMLTVLTWLRGENGQRMVVTGVLATWGLGTVAWFVIQGWRCLLFQKAMRGGRPAPFVVQEQMARLAARCGCSQAPQVWLMPGALSPMLWSMGPLTRLIFPEALFDRLDAVSRETLLAHELAHFQRRDHWVRFVALFATGLFWWHPVVWWARHAIEASEEECCDAWVVTRGAAPPRRYAEAILETVDFIAERQWRVPPLGTGLGQLPFLRQRLIWIMRGPRRQDFSRVGRMLCAAFVVGLPFQPTWLGARPTLSVPTSAATDAPLDGGSVLESPASPATALELPDPRDLTQVHSVVRSLPGHSGEIAVASVDQRFIVFIGVTRQWFVDQTLERTIDLSHHLIRTATFANDGLTFVTGGLDGAVRLWDVETFSERNIWQGWFGPISSVAISPDSKWIVSGSRDGVVRMWPLDAPSDMRELPREAAPVSCVRFSADGQSLAVAVGDSALPTSGRLVVWNTNDWSERTAMNWNQPASVVAFGRDGRSLFSGDWLGRVARWNIETGELLGFVEGHQAAIAAAEVSPETSQLAEIAVPELPLNLLVGNANQDETVKSLWNQLMTRAAVFAKPSKPLKAAQPLP